MDHTCHWPGCSKPVPPKLWGCSAHWFTLPKTIRDRIWQTYVPWPGDHEDAERGLLGRCPRSAGICDRIQRKKAGASHAAVGSTFLMAPDAMANEIALEGWCLYLLECKGGLLYAGITNRLAKRFAAHQAGKGAKFTRANPPLRIVGARPFPDRAAALRAEYATKKLPRGRKVAYLNAQPTELAAA